MKISKKLIILLSLIAIVSLIGIMYHLIRVNNYREGVETLTFSEIDISTIPDGTYYGECDVDLVSAKVEVIVKDGKMEAINLIEHKNGRGESGEQVIDDMITNQTTDVDAISGATSSSKVIRKAVENALLGA